MPKCRSSTLPLQKAPNVLVAGSREGPAYKERGSRSGQPDCSAVQPKGGLQGKGRADPEQPNRGAAARIRGRGGAMASSGEDEERPAAAGPAGLLQAGPAPLTPCVGALPPQAADLR